MNSEDTRTVPVHTRSCRCLAAVRDREQTWGHTARTLQSHETRYFVHRMGMNSTEHGKVFEITKNTRDYIHSSHRGAWVKARNVETEKRPLLGNGCRTRDNTSAIATQHMRQRWRNCARFEAVTAVATKNAVFWNTKTQFAPHKKHVTSLLQSQPINAM
jgi:hypothetical protein